MSEDAITAQSLASRYCERVEAIHREVYTGEIRDGKMQPATPREWARAQVRIDQEWIRTLADAADAGISERDMAEAICEVRQLQVQAPEPEWPEELDVEM